MQNIEAMKKVLLELIQMMDEREAKSKGMKGPEMEDDGMESESEEMPPQDPEIVALAKERGQELGETPVTDPEHEAKEDPKTEKMEHASGQELMPETIEELIERKKKEQEGGQED